MTELVALLDSFKENSGVVSLVIALIALFISLLSGKGEKKSTSLDDLPEISGKDIGKKPIKPVDTYKPQPQQQQIPQTKEKPLTEAQLVHERINLIKKFPELSIVEQNKDKFLSYLTVPKNLQETPDPTYILKARRITDMLYKHQKIFLGRDADFTKLQIFNALLPLVVEEDTKK